jgi:mannose-6-phosphate isomerase-like protein (cupin superfamily)
MEPGERVRRHRHRYEEIYTVTRGTGVMHLEGAGDVTLEPGVCVYVPANRVHGQVNSGTEMLEIICSLSPPPELGELPEFVDDEE